MNLEGKLAGYDKKTIAIAVAAIILAGLAFYGGTAYEKHKLSSMGLLKGTDTSAQGTVGTKKSKKNNATAGAPTDTNNTPSSENSTASPSNSTVENSTSGTTSSDTAPKTGLPTKSTNSAPVAK